MTEIPKELTKDQSVRIEVIVDGDPKPTVTWLFNAKEILSRDGYKLEKDVANNRYVLNIAKVIPGTHIGTVTVRVKNAVGTTQKQVYLNTVEAPKILTKLANVFLKEGKYAEFSCKFTCNPLASSITWYRNDKEEVIENDDNLVISMLGGAESETILRLMKPTANDNGANYMVRIKNDLGEAASSKGFLNISSGPVFMSEPFDRSVLKEKEAKFETIIKGNPRPNVTWYFGDKELLNKDTFDVDKGEDK